MVVGILVSNIFVGFIGVRFVGYVFLLNWDFFGVDGGVSFFLNFLLGVVNSV